MMSDDRKEPGNEDGVPEILALLPDCSDKAVLVLGVGIGAFTGYLAEKATSVIVVDSSDSKHSYVEKLSGLNGEHRQRINVIYISDVLKLDIPDKSVDLIFSSWLLMTMNDEQAQIFFSHCLRWLKDDGHLFFRESCVHHSGALNAERAVNPRVNPVTYRDPMSYTAGIHMASMSCDDIQKGQYGYEILRSQPIHMTHTHIKANYDDIWWLVQKVHHTSSSDGTFQEFLDQQQYSTKSILSYEKVFGKHFVSPGGRETTVDFVKMLDLQPKQSVLDVGSGIGGSAFYMAETYGVEVTGIDLSYNMVNISWQRSKEIDDSRVRFLVADATKIEIADQSFDVVYSRDTILHIPDKDALFQRFLGWLKPGGKLLITDYCCSDEQHAQHFQDYVKQRGYSLVSPGQYGKILEKVGFVNVKAEDKTDLFMEILDKELNTFSAQREQFIQEFSLQDYDGIVDGWKDKQVRCGSGDQRWGLFYAEKQH